MAVKLLMFQQDARNNPKERELKDFNCTEGDNLQITDARNNPKERELKGKPLSPIKKPKRKDARNNPKERELKAWDTAEPYLKSGERCKE